MSSKFLGNFSQTMAVPPNMPSHPDSIQIFGFRLFNEASFIGIPIISPNNNDSVHLVRFICKKCNRWLKLSGTIGNIHSHLRSLHYVPSNNDQRQISSFGRAQLFREFCLIAGLPLLIIQ